MTNQAAVKVIESLRKSYKAGEFSALTDEQFESIASLAVERQQSGTGRMNDWKNFETVAECAHYQNAFAASFKVNGLPVR